MRFRLFILLLSCLPLVPPMDGVGQEIVPLSGAELRGKVTDGEGKPLSRVSVVIVSESDSSAVGYAFSDKQGRFRLKVAEQGKEYVLRLSHIGHETVTCRRKADGKGTVIRMDADGVVLQDVVVEARPRGVFVHGDTVNYNLRKYTDGTEQVLGDMLAKLPGIEVDANGQVTANGKKVDKILVDGNSFVGDHSEQMTQNMPSAMVNKIQLLNNYSEYSVLDGFNTHNKPAINVGIDSAYRHRPTGNAELWGGYGSRYRGKLNLYSFGTKSMWGFNVKAYNTGEETMSLIDYVKLQGGIDNFARSLNGANGMIDDIFQSLPYMDATTDTYKRRNVVSSVNVAWNPNDKTKVNAYCLYSHERSYDRQTIERQYLNDGRRETLASDGDRSNDFAKACVDVTYKPSKQSEMRNNLSLTAYSRDNTSSLFDIANQLQRLDDKNYCLHENLSYARRYGTKSLLTLNAYAVYSKDKVDILLSSDTLLIPHQQGANTIAQTLSTAKYQVGGSLALTRKISRAFQLKGMAFGDVRQTTYWTTSPMAEYSAEKAHNALRNVGAEVVLKKTAGVLRFDLGVKSAYVGSRYASHKFYVTPKASLDLNFSTLHTLSVSYDASYRQADKPLFVSLRTIDNYNTTNLYHGTAVNMLKRSQNVSLAYNYFSVLRNISLVLTSGYTIDHKPFISNDTYRDRSVETSWLEADKGGKTLYATLNFRKELSIPLKLASKVKYHNSMYQSAYAGTLSDDAFENLTASLSLTTTCKSRINVELSGNLSYRKLSVGFSDMRATFHAVELSVRPFYVIKNLLNVEMPFSYIFDKYSADRERYWTASPKMSCRLGKAFTIFVEGENIFNMKRFERISMNTENGYIDKIKECRLPGYAIIGVKYSY